MSDVDARDRERIEELHRTDVQASTARDCRTLRSLMPDGAWRVHRTIRNEPAAAGSAAAGSAGD